jgi:predicted dehydrogenase
VGKSIESFNMLKVGIVGCGKIADAHVDQVRATGMAQVVAVADREILMAQQLSQRMDIAHQYTDLVQMIQTEKLDVVHIATPPDSHLALSKIAFEHGCHVFLEKPIALTTEQTRAILAASQQANKLVSVNYLYNFESPYLQLQKLIADGQVGDIIHLDAAYGYDLNGEYGMAVLSDPNHWVHRLPGKLFHNVLDHVMCKVAPFIGQEFETVAFSSRRRPATGNPVVDALPDELRFMLQSDKVSVSGYISAHAKPVTHTLKVLGSKNSYLLDFVSRTCTPVARQRFPASVGRLIPAIDQARAYSGQTMKNLGAFWNYDYHFFMGMRRLLVAFYSAIQSNGSNPISAHDLISSSLAIDAVINHSKMIGQSQVQTELTL